MNNRVVQIQKKPVIIEAIQFTCEGENYKEISNFIGKPCFDGMGVVIDTVWEGRIRVAPLDWIVKNINGHFDIIPNTIFKRDYEIVE